jgi:hypothetical protein
MISALASETIVHIATTPEKDIRHHTLAVTASGSCVRVCPHVSMCDLMRIVSCRCACACHVVDRVRVHAGAVYAFGDATDGKLGLGELGHTVDIIHTPQIVSALLSEKIIKVHAAGRSPTRVSSDNLPISTINGVRSLYIRWVRLAHTVSPYLIAERSFPGVRMIAMLLST